MILVPASPTRFLSTLALLLSSIPLANSSSLQLILYPHHLLFLILLFLCCSVPHSQALSPVPSTASLPSPHCCSTDMERKWGNWYQFFFLSLTVFLLLFSAPFEENKSLPLFTEQQLASDLSYIYIFYTIKNGPWGEVDGELPGEWEKVGGECVEVRPPTPQNCLSCPKSYVCNTGSQVLLVKEEDSAVFLQQIQRWHAAGALFPGQCCFFWCLLFQPVSLQIASIIKLTVQHRAPIGF